MTENIAETGTGMKTILKVNEQELRGHVNEVVRQTVEETLNGLLEAEADRLCGAECGFRGLLTTDFGNN